MPLIVTCVAVELVLIEHEKKWIPRIVIYDRPLR